MRTKSLFGVILGLGVSHAHGSSGSNELDSADGNTRKRLRLGAAHLICFPRLAAIINIIIRPLDYLLNGSNCCVTLLKRNKTKQQKRYKQSAPPKSCSILRNSSSDKKGPVELPVQGGPIVQWLGRTIERHASRACGLGSNLESDRTGEQPFGNIYDFCSIYTRS